MPFDIILDGMNYEGQVSVRRRKDGKTEYLGGGDALSCIQRFSDCAIKSSCNIDGVLIIYVC